jgi:genome maintenance exonuclease 1
MTLLIEKFQYPTTTRTTINGKRHYDAGDGIPVPSVTTILDATKDKTFLHEWRKRVGEQAAQQITTEAAGVGTSMHKYLEDYVKGEPLTPKSNMVHQQGFKMAHVIIEKGMSNVSEMWGSEVNLCYPGLYAGTTDGVGVFNGNPAIIDFKQTNKPKKEEWVEDYYLQLVAYAMAHNEMHGTDIKYAHILMCSRELQYQQFDITPDTFNKWSDKWLERVQQYYDSR